MTCICPSRESATFVVLMESLVQNFLCIIFLHIRKLFEKAENKHLELVVYSVYGM